MKTSIKKSIATFGLVVAMGAGTLGTGASAFAATSSGSTGNAASSFATSTGANAENSNYNQLIGEFFKANSVQAYNAQTGANSSSFDLDTSKNYLADIGYTKTMMWTMTSGSDMSNSAMQQAAGFGFANQQASNALAKTRTSSTGAASVTVNGHVQTGESVKVGNSQTTMPNGSNSSVSSLETAKTSVINGNSGTTLVWNNSTSTEASNNTSHNSSQADVIIPTFTWNAATGAYTQS